jgi:hypothetical protein
LKARAYVRVGRSPSGKARMLATLKPSNAPLTDARGHALPTVAFAIDFAIPDDLFKQAENVLGEIEITGSRSHIAAELKTS